jgi:hypothetical protein
MEIYSEFHRKIKKIPQANFTFLSMKYIFKWLKFSNFQIKLTKQIGNIIIFVSLVGKHFN